MCAAVDTSPSDLVAHCVIPGRASGTCFLLLDLFISSSSIFLLLFLVLLLSFFFLFLIFCSFLMISFSFSFFFFFFFRFASLATMARPLAWAPGRS